MPNRPKDSNPVPVPPGDLRAWLRLEGRDAPASQVLQRLASRDLPVEWSADASPAGDDSLIDLTLDRAEPAGEVAPAGTTYKTFSPTERGAFWQWVSQAHQPAPRAFQQLLLAHMELGLLEEQAGPRPLDDLLWLHENSRWSHSPTLTRVLLLQLWLRREIARLIAWSAHARDLAPDDWGLLLGWQALAGVPLQPEQLPPLLNAWRIGGATANAPLRVGTLTELLGEDPLAHALDRGGDADRAPRPWRGAHRAVRLTLPQPNLRPMLAPLLADQASVQDVAPARLLNRSLAAPAAPPRLAEEGWHLILEFGQSRSDYFHTALSLAERMDSFTQLMDENRNVVYRVMFHRHKLRNFWRLWNYVEGWSSTRVYVRGEELAKWKVWRYSQFLQ